MYSIYLNIFEVYILVAVRNLIIWHNGKKKDIGLVIRIFLLHNNLEMFNTWGVILFHIMN